jgi:membrane fusion protein (multidrug efflux system)
VVVVAPVSREEFFDRIEAIGTAFANESVVVTAQVTESVQRVNFEDGQEVEAGAVLVELTSAEESAQLAEVRANHAEALRQYQRISELVAGGSESRARLDERTAARDASEARLRELEARLADRLIRAPFRGVLGLRSVSPGTLVRPGDAITTLDDVEVVKLDFTVPETFLGALHPGLEIEAESVAFPERSFSGKVTAVDTRVDPRTRAVRARAAFPNPDHALRPGMLLTVALIANRRTSLAVPEQALVPVGQEQYVFVVDGEERAQRVLVRIGGRRPGLAEVESGLDGSELVILEGADQVRPGDLVRIASREGATGG